MRNECKDEVKNMVNFGTLNALKIFSQSKQDILVGFLRMNELRGSELSDSC